MKFTRETITLIILLFTFSLQSLGQLNPSISERDYNRVLEKALKREQNGLNDYQKIRAITERDNPLTQIGSFGYGTSITLFVDTVRDVAVVGCGQQMLLYDISIPGQPVSMEQELKSRGYVADMTFDYSENILYVAVTSGGVEIWDMNDYSEPKLLSVIPAIYDLTTDLIVKKDHYLIGVSKDVYQMEVYDVSDVNNPELLYTYYPSGTKECLEIHDNIILLGDLTSHDLYYINPNGTLSIYASGPPLGDVVAGYMGNNYIYMLNSSGNFIIRNYGLSVISERQLPYASTPFADVEVVGNYAFVIAAFNGLQVIDVSNPSSPSIVASANYSGDALYAVDGRLFYSSGGLVVYDVDTPQSPSLLIHIELPYGPTYNIVPQDGFGIAQQLTDTHICDFSDLSSPAVLSTISTSNYDYSLCGGIKDHIAVLGFGAGGIMIYDISDLENPVQLSTVSGNYVRHLQLEGNYAYYSDNDVLKVLDIIDPNDPTIVATTTLPGNELSDLKLQNETLYAAVGSGGLAIVDISNPVNPELITSFVPSPDIEAISVSVSGNMVYLQDFDTYLPELYAIDVSDPESPVLITSYTFSDGEPSDHFNSGIIGDFLYLGNLGLSADTYGTTVFDISDPEALTKVGFQQESSSVFGLTTFDGKVFVGTQHTGYRIYQGLGTVSTPELIQTDNKLVLSVFPNPNKGEFVIDLQTESNQPVNVEIFNNMGALVYQNTLNFGSTQMTIKIRDLPSGVYQVVAKQNKTQTIEKIVIR